MEDKRDNALLYFCSVDDTFNSNDDESDPTFQGSENSGVDLTMIRFNSHCQVTNWRLSEELSLLDHL